MKPYTPKYKCAELSFGSEEYSLQLTRVNTYIWASYLTAYARGFLAQITNNFLK